MADASQQATRGRLHSLFETGTAAGLTDGQLLERFVTGSRGAGESAFAALVERHGPAVSSVCRGVLRDRHDAEDAFQATFLVLARRAGAIRRRDSVASWLHGVALRVAAGARADAARRRRHESARAGAAEVAPPAGDGAEAGRVVHEEVARLPDRDRAAVVLCFFEGLTHEEAAGRLGWPVGTVKSRLARAKARLRDRLTRRGIAAPAALAGVRPAGGAVTAALADATAAVAARFCRGGAGPWVSGSVESLAKGVLRAMMFTRLRNVGLFALSVGFVVAGAGVLAGPGRGDTPAPEGAAPEPEDRETVAGLARRLDEVERKLDAVLAARPVGAPGGDQRPPGPPGDALTMTRTIQPRFECLVEKVFVRRGDAVKKGDPLVELFSEELATAKNAFLSRSGAWKYQQTEYDRLKTWAKNTANPDGAMLRIESDRGKSRVEMNAARDRLILYGLTPAEIHAIKEEDEDKARFTLRSPVDGVIGSVHVTTQDLCDRKSTLVQINTAQP